MKRIPCPLSTEELRHLTHDLKLTDTAIATRIPGATTRRVYSWRVHLGIQTLPKWSRNDVSPIQGKLRSLLVGSMLGDGRIVRQVNASYYSERHCEAQRAYLEWKAAIWGARWTGPTKAIPDKRGFLQVGMTTCAHAMLNDWQALFYADLHKGWKRLVPQIVDAVDAFALAVWYLDDGSAAWWPEIAFGADAASRAVAWSIFDKFGLKPRWALKVRNTGAFIMEREDVAERFLELIRPHVPACMGYKLGPFGFQGPHHQVRIKLSADVLRQMSAEGVSLRAMAERLSVGTATIARWLVKHGITHPRKIGRPAQRSPSNGAST